jgi:hypothetical protein
MGRIYLNMKEEVEAGAEILAGPAQPTTRTNKSKEWDSTEL